MELWILLFGVIAVIAVLVYATRGDHAWRKSTDGSFSDLWVNINSITANDKSNTNRWEELKEETRRKTEWLEERHDAHAKEIADLLEICGKLRKELEVMTIRQRTLEKKLIERAVNVNIMGLDNLKPKRGAGRAALIKER